MTDLKKLFKDAETAGILNRGQPENLTNFFIEKGEIETPKNTSDTSTYFAELDENKNTQIETDSESSEMPRLVRGFHDVLITIGIVVVLCALFALTNLIVVIIATWVLSEFFIKKQNLALPAFVLSMVFICGVSVVAFSAVDSWINIDRAYSTSFVSASARLLIILAMVSVYYWRFRVPVTLAVLITGAHAILFFFVFYTASKLIGIVDSEQAFTTIGRGLGLVFAAILFAVSLKLDSSDILRKTKRSDVAFWLNLLVAPTMLYSLLSLVFLNEEGLKLSSFGVVQAVAVLVIISAMMLIGVVIDRRAFVTAGLLSLGGAVFVLVKNLDVGYTSFFSISALIVGIIVLTIGVGWEFLRRQIVPNLPSYIVERVPPVERHNQ
ncbi:MAG: hypothetical protein COC17_00630 [Hyphomicrobiales bacterium]|nr:hypothetical protein [Hyphomicrobiales bacterium]PCH51629.1 MAG: hypothetical protein COC17_00630 [Hyphomicrobiales bacterium]